jgi:hypothetical protein
MISARTSALSSALRSVRDASVSIARVRIAFGLTAQRLPSISRKLRRRSLPCSVNTDSG